MSDLYLAIDLGGSHLRYATMQKDQFQLLDKEKSPQTPDDFYWSLGQILDKLPQAPVGIGLALAGTVDHKRGLLLHPANLPSWKVEPIQREIFQRFGLPCQIGNDANLACLGEAVFGAGQGVQNLLMMTLGTGIGSGTMIEGLLLQGAGGLAMEAGHIPVSSEGPICGCGGRGHLESFASGTALARMAKAKGLVVQRAEEVFQLARTDPAAQAVIEEGTGYLALGLVALVHLLDPEVILFGGGMSDQWEDYVQPAIKIMEKQLMPVYQGKIKVRPAKLGDDAGLWGAIALVRDASRG